ncbi:hypothetical protein PAENIP36_17320 [Paenibacillus sp. P36]
MINTTLGLLGESLPCEGLLGEGLPIAGLPGENPSDESFFVFFSFIFYLTLMGQD